MDIVLISHLQVRILITETALHQVNIDNITKLNRYVLWAATFTTRNYSSTTTCCILKYCQEYTTLTQQIIVEYKWYSIFLITRSYSPYFPPSKSAWISVQWPRKHEGINIIIYITSRLKLARKANSNNVTRDNAHKESNDKKRSLTDRCDTDGVPEIKHLNPFNAN